MFSLTNKNRRNPIMKMNTYSEQNFTTVNKPPVNKQLEYKPQDYSIKIMYIYSTKFTLFFADNLKSYFESINIESKIINSSISNIDIEECRNNPNLYFFIIGPQYFIKLSRDYILKTTGKPLNDLPKNKYIFYQIEQLNQTQNTMNSISELDDLFEKSYAIFDYSTVNLKYYSDNLRENVKLLSPLIYQEDINLESLQEDTFAKEFTNKIIDRSLKIIKNKSEMNILFIGTINDRREKILNRLKEDGYNVKIISKTIEQELIEEIKKSEIVLNLHYYPNSLLEIFRIHDLLPYHCKILSENPGNEEEMDLVEKYSNVVSFFPVINDDLSNIDKMYKLIIDNLNNEIDLIERKKFIEDVNDYNFKKIYNIIVLIFNNKIYNKLFIDNIIPKNIFQCWHSKILPNSVEYCINNIKFNNPDFNHYLYDINDCREFIKKNFDLEVLNTFDDIIPFAIKIDLWRYCILYKYGGIYLDVKYSPINNFKFKFLLDEIYLCKDLPSAGLGIYNAFIIINKNNSLMKDAINKVVENTKKKFYGKNALCPTGPWMLKDLCNINIYNNIKLYLKYDGDIRKEIDFEKLFIYFKNLKILSFHKNYRIEQKKIQNHWATYW